MRFKLPCLFLVLAGLIVGCASLPNSFIEGEHGEYMHKHSGVVFPLNREWFVRGEITEFTPDGYDVGVTYIHPEKLIKAAIIVYPTAFGEPDLEQEFSGLQDTVLESPMEAVLINEWEASRENTTVKGCVYTIVNAIEKNREDFLMPMLYSHKSWYLLYRATAPITSELTDMMQPLFSSEGDVVFVPTKEYPIPE